MVKCGTYVLRTALCLISFIDARGQELDSLPYVIPDAGYESPVTATQHYDFEETRAKEPVGSRQVSSNELQKLKSDRDYWYINEKPPDERETKPPDENRKGRQQVRSRGAINLPWLNSVFWILLIAGFVTLLVWFLSTSDIRLFRKRPEDEPRAEDQPTENIFVMNFEKEIQNAISNGNYRMAVRLLYLRVLRDLSSRNLIQYSHEKTNSDYLLQLGPTPYYKNFFRLTRSFDYTWYGQFDLSADSFALIQNDFSSFSQQLSA